MDFIRIPFGMWVEEIVIWLTDHFATLFDSITMVINIALNQLKDMLVWLPWPVTIIIVVVFAWRVAGRRVAMIAGLFLYFLGSFNLWNEGLNTLVLVATSVSVSVLFGLPLGIPPVGSSRLCP